MKNFPNPIIIAGVKRHMINIKNQNPVIAILLTGPDLQPVQYALYCLLILNL